MESGVDIHHKLFRLEQGLARSWKLQIQEEDEGKKKNKNVDDIKYIYLY